MRKLAGVLIFIGLTSVLFAEVLSETVATVNLTKPEMITSRQVQDEIDAYNRELKKRGLPPREITKKQMLENMISSILILQAAKRDGITVSSDEMQKVIDNQMKSVEKQLHRKITLEQFKKIVTSQTGNSWNAYVKNLKDQLIKQTYVTRKKSKIFKAIKQPTEQEIENKYQDNITKFVSPEYIRVSMIYISTINKTAQEKEAIKKKLDKAYKEIKNGALSFEDAVQKYCSDTAIKARGGDIGYIRRDDRNFRARLGDRFFNEIFSLPVNQISGVLESNTGYQIVKVTEKMAPKVLGLYDPIAPGKTITVHDYLKAGIYQEKEQQALQKALKEVVAELKKEAEITIF